MFLLEQSLPRIELGQEAEGWQAVFGFLAEAAGVVLRSQHGARGGVVGVHQIQPLIRLQGGEPVERRFR